MNRNIQLATSNESLRAVAERMEACDIGYMPVGENDRLVGAVTDRDIAIRGVGAGPSVLYDAVAILTSAEGADRLKAHPAALDFIGDAWAHRKFIAWAPDADALMTEAGVAPPNATPASRNWPPPRTPPPS